MNRSKWIQGSDVLTRLDLLLFQLVDLCREGVFVPRSEDGGWITPEDSDRCLFCDMMVGAICPYSLHVVTEFGEGHDCHYRSSDEKTQYLKQVFLGSWYSLTEIEAYEQSQGLEVPPQEAEFEHAKDHAESMLENGVPKGKAMKELRERWKLTCYEAAALVLGERLPIEDKDRRKSLNDSFTYHTKNIQD